MKRWIKAIVVGAVFAVPAQLKALPYLLTSPDKRIEITINTKDELSYSVKYKDAKILATSRIGLQLKTGLLGESPKLMSAHRNFVQQEYKPAVKIKAGRIEEHYNELILRFKENFAVCFRAFNDGFGYRFESFEKAEMEVVDELCEINFAENAVAYWPAESHFISPNQRYYDETTLANLNEKDLASLAALFKTNSGVFVAVTETALNDYPGMWLRGVRGNGLKADFPRYPVNEEHVNEGKGEIERRDFIARTNGTRSFPWRVFGLTTNEGDLITNQLPWLLAEPSKIADPSWIKPGKIAWDWYNDNNIYDVDFKSGINTSTYKYYIDFAARYGIEYVVLDEGWSKHPSLLAINPDIDMDELAGYAKQKGVDLILWAMWKEFDEQKEQLLPLLKKWDIKGIKVDFMDRDDQWMENFYHRTAEFCARNKLLLDFHGAHKPAGLERTWPNVMTYESVKGLEQCKWSDKQTPKHDVLLPFIRMWAGPMDYTPGAMINAQKKNFRICYNRPMSMGTRCHQLAMYVVFESPLQMLADNPSNYKKEEECMEFLSVVPTVWDETVVLDAKIGKHVAVARRNGNVWYVGSLGGDDACDVSVPMSFLDSGEYEMIVYKDGVNADRYAQDYKKGNRTITKDMKLNIHMAPGGGYVAIIKQKENRL